MRDLKEIDLEIEVATAGLRPEEIAKDLADTAEAELAAVIADGEASESYTRFVNGREGVPEEQVVPPGPIVYLFHYSDELATWALQWARDNSPIESGRYRDAWFVMVNGVRADPKDVPPDAEIVITNDEPYARKIETSGKDHFSVPPGIVERLRLAVLSQFGAHIASAEIRYIALEGGYVLHGRGRRSRSRHAGEEMTYPALVLKPAA